MSKRKYAGLQTAGVSAAVRRAIYKRDGYMCAICGDPRSLQIHHYIPRAKGGADHPMNLITLCPYCHNVAHGQIKPPADYLDLKDFKTAMVAYLADLYAERYDQVWYPYDG